MPIRLIVCGALLLGLALADDPSSHAQLLGSWVLADNGASQAPSTLTLSADNNNLRVAKSDADHKSTTFECGTMGQECEVKDAGRNVKVSFWFNGPKLVELETHGSDVVKRVYNLLPSGDSLEVQVTPVSPEGKSEVYHFKRAANSMASGGAAASAHK
jgi:hypothetical protein